MAFQTLRTRAAILAAAAVLTSCGGAAAVTPALTAPPEEAASTATPSPTAAARAQRRDAPPDLNLELHSVPLAAVVFDTFDGGSVALPEAPPALIARLRDAIRPIYEPRYAGVSGGDWLREDDLVVGYAGTEAAFAYPVKMLNFHEIVNDEIDGIPLVVTYCPLCGSGVVYDRRVDGRTLDFGNTSALYQTDLVMYDWQTGSYWYQTAGEAIVGELTGSRLRLLPSMTLPWKRWKDLHPDTRVLARDQGFGRSYPYERDSFAGYENAVESLRFPFPVDRDKIGSELRPSEIVISVRAGETEKAYSMSRLGVAAVNDEIGGQPVVVLTSAIGPFAGAYSPLVGGRRLTFSIDRGTYVDAETGSTWDIGGSAVSGPLSGKCLDPLPARRAFWFSISLSVPGIEIYTQGP